MFQELCESKVGWDDEISHPVRVKWERLVAELVKMKRIVLPDCYFCNIREKVISSAIYGFCDASKMAYAGVTYLVVKTTGNSYVRFLASNTAVAPIDKQSIPRLELLSF